MKRANHLYKKIISLDNLTKAFFDAKKKKKNKMQVFAFEKNLACNLLNLHESLKSETYTIQPYREFVIKERKQRRIYAPHFRDLVVQHAIYRKIYPVVDKKLHPKSFGVRKGKGTKDAKAQALKALRALKRGYYLQCDIRKYFYSINREILRSKLQRILKEEKLLDLIMQFANTNEAKGVPLGNLLSQLFGLLYLNDLDFFNTKFCKYYLRYVDDFVLFFESKEEAKEHLKNLKEFLKTQDLELSKANLSPLFKKLKIVGYDLFKYKSRIWLKPKKKPESNTSLMGFYQETQGEFRFLQKLKENYALLQAKRAKRAKRQDYHLSLR